MSYEEREISVHSGDPVECYLLIRGSQEWRLTSADRPIVLSGLGVYEPGDVRASGQDLREEDQNGGVEIQVPRTSPIIAPYISSPPAEKTWVRIFRAHRGEEEDAVCIFVGWISGVTAAGGSIATVQCASLLGGMGRRIPGLAYAAQCSRALYGPGCDVVAADFRDSITVTGISGSTVTSPQFALRANGWFTAGWLERSNGDRRMIVAHTGDAVQLMSPFVGLATSEALSAYAGCDLTRAACVARFDNAANFLGFEYIPMLDPHRQRIG